MHCFFFDEICCDWGICFFFVGAYVFLGGVPEANPSARDMRGNNEIMCRTSIEGWWFKGMGTICEYYKSLCLWHKWGYVTIVPICIHNITYIFIHICYIYIGTAMYCPAKTYFFAKYLRLRVMSRKNRWSSDCEKIFPMPILCRRNSTVTLW